MSKRGTLIVISGPSGVGKGTVLNELTGRNDKVVLSVSATTREPRPDDIEGINYFFKTPEQFRSMIDGGELMEWAVYNGNYYGTPISYVENNLSSGHDVILEIDVQGALKLMPDYKNAVYIFIAPESIEVLRERLCGRGTETSEQIEKRIQAAEWELTQKDKYDHVVINRVVKDAADEILNIISKERCKL